MPTCVRRDYFMYREIWSRGGKRGCWGKDKYCHWKSLCTDHVHVHARIQPNGVGVIVGAGGGAAKNNLIHGGLVQFEGWTVCRLNYKSILPLDTWRQVKISSLISLRRHVYHEGLKDNIVK